MALDLRWSWSHAGDVVWRRIDPVLWKRTHNPWVVLTSTSSRHLQALIAEPEFRESIERLASETDESRRAATWFDQNHAGAVLSPVAYFSMEFMLSEALPIYAGGLGNVAGDQLKAASDLGIPVVGIGLLYQQGYFRQIIDRQGSQQALYPYNDPTQLPLRPLLAPDGERLRLEIRLPGQVLWLRAWEVTVGRLRLLLLDSNDSANHPAHRGITSELYGGNAELRLQQEIVLGIGGWRLLERLGVQPEVCHLNEGHAAFAVLDRARSFMERHGVVFDTALCATRAGNVFTTHTAVSTGFDRFSADLIEHYFGEYADRSLRIRMRELLALGRAQGADDREPFNMAYLAARASGFINAVSRLHAEVTRRIFAPLFPRRPLGEMPIASITNGVHSPSWDGVEADELWTRCCGKARWLGSLTFMQERIRALSDSAIWQCRARARAGLVEYVRELLAEQLTAAGAEQQDIEAAKTVLDPDHLTLGFARRFTGYKRPNLLLQDPERLARLLTNRDRPVQIIVAGKAHPDDLEGQAMIREWVHFVRRYDVRPHAVFLSDHDMLMTEQLASGVDVWINTPRRPWEACGTSGMKLLVNGGLNLSELDGWWAEAYEPAVGWALGDGREHGTDRARDAEEAALLYRILETQVVPEYHARAADGIPRCWVARVRESMASLTPAYSANRSVRDYLERAYLPAASAFRRRAADGAALAKEISAWHRALDLDWPQLRLLEVQVESRDDGHRFTAHANLGSLMAAVRLELYADAWMGGPSECIVMRPAGASGREGTRSFEALVCAARPASDYTVRIVPHHAEVKIPLEASHILWQK